MQFATQGQIAARLRYRPFNFAEKLVCRTCRRIVRLCCAFSCTLMCFRTKHNRDTIAPCKTLSPDLSCSLVFDQSSQKILAKMKKERIRELQTLFFGCSTPTRLRSSLAVPFFYEIVPTIALLKCQRPRRHTQWHVSIHCHAIPGMNEYEINGSTYIGRTARELTPSPIMTDECDTRSNRHGTIQTSTGCHKTTPTDKKESELILLPKNGHERTDTNWRDTTTQTTTRL